MDISQILWHHHSQPVQYHPRLWFLHHEQYFRWPSTWDPRPDRGEVSYSLYHISIASHGLIT